MKPLSHPGFRDLVIGQTVSALGDWMATFALMVLVLHLSGSSTAVAGVLVLRLVPAMIGGAVAARVIRRWDRRRTMLFMDAIRAGVVVLVPVVRAVWWVYLWAFVLEVLSLVFLPARDSVVPDLVGADDLPTANGIVLASSYGTIPFGAAAFAAAAATSSVDGRFPLLAVFAVDAVTFVVSYTFIRRVQIVHPQTAAASHVGNIDQHPTLRGAFRIPLVHAVLPAVIVISLGLGTLFSLGIVFVRDVLGAGDVAFGLLIVFFGVGAGIGLTVLGQLRGLPAVTTIRWGTAAQGITIAVMSLSPSIVPAFVGAATFGAATALTLATGMSTLQDRLDGVERVLAFAAFHSTIRGGLALAAVATGAAVDLVGTVHLPVVGHVSPTRFVLLSAGAAVALGSSMVRLPAGASDLGLDRR